jgi:hypothetical protein
MFEKYLIVMAMAAALFLLAPHLMSTEAPTASRKQNPVIYEISLRPWLFELTKKYGKTVSRLADIPDAEFQHL